MNVAFVKVLLLSVFGFTLKPQGRLLSTESSIGCREKRSAGSELMELDGRSNAVILVADDEELIRHLISAILSQGPYRLLIASDGEEALAMSRAYSGHIDLLLTDLT